MKILRLELFGFKSFKDKTVVTFDQPITAVVGSNGCGKSNIVDALYWVMGDMSPKHLRGSHMSDVIFSGSRDAAALDMAEVTLVLERDPTNDPELPPQFQASNEIQITRRYYRSGESECFINKVSCRLRDIQEFFMDTGLGAKAYSIIEQGAIMRMVTQKPEERRSVIEEVAGVMKFKARKAETERKLEHAATNLQRIDDIVKDLQKQLSALKRQAEKAEKFRAFSAELRALEMNLASREWVQRTQHKTESSGLMAQIQQTLEGHEATLETERQLSEEGQAKLTELGNELSARRDESRRLELAVKDTEAKLAALGARRESLSNRLGQDRMNLEEIERREESLTTELATAQEEIAGLKAESTAFHQKADETAARVTETRAATESIRREVERIRKDAHTEELEETRLAQQIQELQRNLAQLSGRQESVRMQLSGIETEHEMRHSERQSTLDYLETAFSKRSDLEAEKTAVDSELADLEKQRHDFQAHRDEVKSEFTHVQIRREQLEALDRDMEGVNATSKVLALHLRDEGTQETLMADTIHVPPLLEKAIESVLGRNLQRVLAKGYDRAEDFQRVLAESGDHEAKQGRSSMWLPDLAQQPYASPALDLNSIYLGAPSAPTKTDFNGTTSRESGSADGDEFAVSAPNDFTVSPADEFDVSASTEIPGPDGMIGTVATLEASAPELVSVKSYLLAHAQVVGPLSELVGENAAWTALVDEFWVVRTKDAFKEILSALGGLPVSLVSLDGDVFTRDGFLDLAPVEAAREQGVGLVQRKREIAELGARQSELETKLQTAQAQFDACIGRLRDAKQKFQDLTARLAALNPDVEKHSLMLRQVEAQVARLMEKRSLLGEELERSVAEQQNVSEKLETISAQLGAAVERKAEFQVELGLIEEKLKASSALQSEQENELSQIQRQAKEHDSRLSQKLSRYAALEQEQSLSQTRHAQIQDEMANLESDIEELVKTVDADHELRTAQQVELDIAIIAVENAARAEATQKRQSHESQRELDRLSAEVQTLNLGLKDTEQALAVNEVELKNLIDRIHQQYQISLDTLSEEQLQEMLAPADLEATADPEAGKRYAQSLRNKIDNLGKINMVAVEEFAELSKRHEYLFIQRQDVDDGIRQLRDAIDKIDRESRHRFAEAFTAVNKAFQDTFPVLFGGGNAELRLTQPDNLLETGVEIVAQPPGKKLQSVTLLSGGEKALTAVSLIFGIFSIKPSPFCVLDEVDAPLDDSNVNRFNAQLRRMSATSQIILVTHHKKTMESCDAMFGVTMERPGISKLASARLGELRAVANVGIPPAPPPTEAVTADA